MFNKSKDNLNFVQLLSKFGELVDNEQSLFHRGTTSFPHLLLFTNNHFNKLWQKLLCKISNIDTIEFQIYGVCTILIALNHQIKTPIAFGVGKVQTLHQMSQINWILNVFVLYECMLHCYVLYRTCIELISAFLATRRGCNCD